MRSRLTRSGSGFAALTVAVFPGLAQAQELGAQTGGGEFCWDNPQASNGTGELTLRLKHAVQIDKDQHVLFGALGPDGQVLVGIENGFLVASAPGSKAVHHSSEGEAFVSASISRRGQVELMRTDGVVVFLSSPDAERTLSGEAVSSGTVVAGPDAKTAGWHSSGIR